MKSSLLLEWLLLGFPLLKSYHAHHSVIYPALKEITRKEVEGLFSETCTQPVSFNPFGEIIFPYHKMGVIDSLNLFDLDELMLFSFYWASRKLYRRVADIGANIGLHSIILSRCGYQVRCFEPDPKHFAALQNNLKLNHCSRVMAYNKAVSSDSGEREFIRVVDNTTGSHIAGSKANPYGALERFPVKVESIIPIIEWADFIKLDAEGQEKDILLATSKDHWLKTDAMVEVENADNAALLYTHFSNMEIKLFSQKNNWGIVRKQEEMPESYRDGSLFVTSKEAVPWV